MKSHEEIIVELTEALLTITISCIKYNYDLYKNDDEMINLIISSHISSLFNLLKEYSHNNPTTEENVNNFISNIIETISKTKDIYLMKNKKGNVN